METGISRLHLLSPLCCVPLEKGEPFDFRPDSVAGEERVFCFELEETQRLSFEPDKDKLPGSLVFRGITASAGGKEIISIGDYLFAQKRKILSRKEIITLAVEIQQEALWQRLIPGNNLYLRYLFEDNSWVTQLFRPYRED